MPTPNPRMALVITEQEREVLADLAAYQGRSAASYVRDLLDHAFPHLKALRDVLRASQAAERRNAEAVAGAVADAFAVSPSDQYDIEAFLGEDGTGVCAESPQARAPVPPPVSNTGVRVDRKGNNRGTGGENV